MAFTILCPTDFTEPSDRALQYAIALAESHDDATIRLLHVDDLPTYGLPDGSVLDEPLRSAWRHRLEDLAERFSDRVRIEPTLGRGRPSTEIIAAAEGADLVVMSTRGRNAPSRALLGSVAHKVVRGCDVPVLTIDPEASAEPPSKLLVMLDLSGASERALEQALRFAEARGARVHVLHAFRLPVYAMPDGGNIFEPELVGGLRADAEIAIAEVLARHPSSVEVRTHIAEGAASDAAPAMVEELGCDLVVMGTHGRSGVSRLFLGSVAERMLRTCRVPVMVVRALDAPE